MGAYSPAGLSCSLLLGVLGKQSKPREWSLSEVPYRIAVCLPPLHLKLPGAVPLKSGRKG